MRRLAAPICVFIFYLLIAVFVTFPLITLMDTRLLGHPFGDTYEYTHHIWAIHHALQTGADPFFQPLLLYPDGLSGTLLWSIPLQFFPQALLIYLMPLPVAHNLTAIVTLALNGWAMWVLLRSELKVKSDKLKVNSMPSDSTLLTFNFQLLTDPYFLAALVGGLVFMTYPAFMGQLGIGHTGLLVLYPVPLLAWALLRLGKRPSPPAPLPRKRGEGSKAKVLESANQSESTVGTSPTSTNLSWRSWRLGGSVLLVSLFFVLSLLGSNLILIYLTLPVTAIIFLRWIARRQFTALRRGLIAVGLGIVFALPFLLPALSETLNAPATFREDASIRFSADLTGIVSPSFYNPLYSGFDYNRAVLGVDPFEGAAYIGVITAALCVIGVWRVRTARWWLLLAVIGWVLSLGAILKVLGEPVSVTIDGRATMISLPYALLQNLPILNLARTPARFNFAVGFAAAVMAGYGTMVVLTSVNSRVSRFVYRKPHPPTPSPYGEGELSAAQRGEVQQNGLGDEDKIRRRASIVIAVLLMAAILLDVRWYTELPTIPAEIPAAIIALSERDDIRAVLDVPFEHLLVDKDGMYLQTGHEQPMIGGHIARRTPLDPAVGWLLQGTLDPALLNMAGVDLIILHKQWDDDAGTLDNLLRERLGTPFYEDERIAVFYTPEADTPPAFLTFSRLPPFLTGSGDLYFYAPAGGTARLTGSLNSTTPVHITVSLDRQPISTLIIDGETVLDIPITYSTGYHTISLAVNPPCPANTEETIRCSGVDVVEMGIIQTD